MINSRITHLDFKGSKGKSKGRLRRTPRAMQQGARPKSCSQLIWVLRDAPSDAPRPFSKPSVEAVLFSLRSPNREGSIASIFLVIDPKIQLRLYLYFFQARKPAEV